MSSKNGKSNRKNIASQKAFNNLALSNVKNSINNYIIYFITLIFGVTILYSFNSIDKQFDLFGKSDLLEAYLNMSKGVIIGASVIICAIFAFLINYANQLLMRKRKREFGIYITLGMNKEQIINLMYKETIIIGGIAFIVGVLLGIFVEQGLSIITANMIGLSQNVFKFGISMFALIKTAIFYVIVLSLINVFNKKTIKKYELIELLNSHKKNELKESNGNKRNVSIFLISITMMILAYFIIINDITSIKKIIISVVIMAIATYNFFLSISDFLITIVKKKKSTYYKNLNMFIISQISSRLKTMSSTITVICLILTLATTIIPIGLATGKSLIKDIKEATPYDVTITRYNTGKDFISNNVIKDNLTSIEEELLAQNFSFSTTVKSLSEVNIYVLDDININSLGIDKYLKTKEDSGFVFIVKLSEYNLARKQQGIDEIQLSDNEYILNSSSKEIRNIYDQYIKDYNYEIEINNTILKPSKNPAENINYMTETMLSDTITLVVNDSVVNNMLPLYTNLNCNYIESNDKYDNMFLSEYHNVNTDDYNYYSKIAINGEKISMNIALTYISVYLGIILFVTAGAILALHQVAELPITKERFNLLKKLGVRKKDREKAMFKQICILYSLPLSLALIHSLSINIGVALGVDAYLKSEILSKVFLTCIILLLVYGTYFIISYNESKNNIDV